MAQEGDFRRLLPWAALAVLAILPFLGTLTHDLVWDDQRLLELIGRVEQAGGVRGVVTTELLLGDMTPERTGFYRPLVLLSLWVDRQAGGGHAAAFHLTNLTLHVLNTLLVFALLALLVPVRAAFWGAGIFAVHPVHTESVAFVSGRSDLMATSLVLTGAILWVRDRQGLMRHSVAGRVAGSLTLLLAAFAKENAVVMPAALLSWEFIAVRPAGAGASARTRRVAAWLLGWCVAIAVFLLVRAEVGVGLTRALGSRGAAGISAALANPPAFFGVWFTYLRLLVFPFPANPWYTEAAVRVTVAGVVAAVLLAGLCWTAARKEGNRSGALAAVWFLIFLGPAVTARLEVVLAERFLYLPSVALALAAGGLGARAEALTGSRIRAVWALWGAIVLLGLAVSFSHSRIWRDNFTLFRHVTVVSPDSALGLKNFGAELSKAGRHREAVEYYQRALAFRPGDAALYYNLGYAYQGLGDRERAAAAYREALRLKPDMVDATIRLWQLRGGR